MNQLLAMGRKYIEKTVNSLKRKLYFWRQRSKRNIGKPKSTGKRELETIMNNIERT